MKDLLIELFEELERETKYDFEELQEMYFRYADECAECGEEIDLEYFKNVTMENDW